MKRRQNSLSGWLLFPLLALGGVLGVGGLQVWQGQIEFPWTSEQSAPETKPAAASREGLVAVPICHQDIPAYTKIRRDHMWDPRKKSFHYFYMEEGEVPEGVLTSISQIRGRVLRNNKRRGFVFSEEDFYPKGTREGLVAAIPPGKRSLRVSTIQVRGLHELRPGDRFDVIAAQKVDADSQDLRDVNLGGDLGSVIALQAKMSNAFNKANVTVIVRDGTVIQPVQLRAQPTTSTSFTGSTRVKTRPVQEVVIALAPDEATKLAQAFATSSDIWCLPRSGRPDGTEQETQDLTATSPLDGVFGPDGNESGGVTFLEKIQGAERARVAVPRTETKPTPLVRLPRKPEQDERPASQIERKKGGK